MKYQCVGPLIGLSQRACCKVKIKRRCGRWSTSTCSCVQVTYSYRFPLPETETLLKWSRHRDATVDHPAYMSKTSRFSCIDWRDQVSAKAEFAWCNMLHRRVRTSKFLMRLTCRSLPGTLVFFNRCCGPTVRTNLQPNLCWGGGNRNPILRTKISCLAVRRRLNKTST